jgi:hypothetical protein
MSDRALIEEALRVYRRYQDEIVEAYGLCPWATRARKEGRVAERVVLSRTPDPEPILEAIDALGSGGTVEVGLVLLPRLALDRPAFDRFVAGVVRADAERRSVGSAPFAMAGFHPDAEPDMTDPERLIPFIRRTPDPTIQLVRLEALDRVREGYSDGTAFVDIRQLVSGPTVEDTLPLRERIARANHRVVARVGSDRIGERLDAIRRDRNASYARLGEVVERRTAP